MIVIVAMEARANDVQFVVADAVRVRETPDSASREVARLRIGTEVVVRDRDGDRALVELVGRPEAWPVRGWVPGAYVGDRPTVEGLLADAAVADDPVHLWKRAASLDPTAEDPWALLEAQGVGPSRPGSEDVWLAVCRRGRTELVAHLGADGPITPATVPDLSVDALRELGTTLAGRPWFTEQGPVAGTPFPVPFVAGTWNESPSPWGPDPDVEAEPSVLVLGPCAAEGAVATAPLRPVGVSGLAAEGVRRGLDVVTGDGVRVSVLATPEPSVVEVQHTVRAVWKSCGGEQWYDDATGVALVGLDGALAAFGGPWLEGPVSAEAGTWWAIRVGGVERSFRIGPARGYLDAGVVVSAVGGDRVEHAFVTLESWGC